MKHTCLMIVYFFGGVYKIVGVDHVGCAVIFWAGLDFCCFCARVKARCASSVSPP